MTLTAPRAGTVTTTTAPAPSSPAPSRAPWVIGLIGVFIAAVGYGAATLAHQLVPAIGVLTWAVALGMVAANIRLIPAGGKVALSRITKKLLRVGIVLLGFSVSFAAIAALGLSGRSRSSRWLSWPRSSSPPGSAAASA